MTSAPKPKTAATPPPSLDEATAQADALWARYHAARAEAGSSESFEALRKDAARARQLAKKRLSEPGFAVLAQRLQDLGQYIRTHAPRPTAALSLEAIVARADALLQQAHHLPAAQRNRQVAALRVEIERARRRDQADDEDHDKYVDVEERLATIA